MILPMPRSGGPSTAPFSTLASAFAGMAAMASMSSSVGARGLSASKLPDRSKISPSRMMARLLAGYGAVTDELHACPVQHSEHLQNYPRHSGSGPSDRPGMTSD
jgi:hypothetical protein